MANRTDPSALSAHGTNPQFLIDKIVRSKIWACSYWKEECWALDAESFIDKAIEIEGIGGMYAGNTKPTKFICLVLKMLQIAPEKEIIYELIGNTDYKYVTAIGCYYLRLTGQPDEIYKRLEPMYMDYRKLRIRNSDGKYSLIHMDEFIDDLLHKEIVLDQTLPKIPKRLVLEEIGQLRPRESKLEQLLIEEDNAEEEPEQTEEAAPVTEEKEDGLEENPKAAAMKEFIDELAERKRNKKRSKSGSKSKSKSKSRSRSRSKDRKKKHRKHRKHKSRSRSKSKDSRSRSKSHSRSRSRSRSKDKHRKKDKKSSWKSRLKEKRREKAKDGGDDKARSKSNEKEEGQKEKKVEEFSVEYWNNIRAGLGLKPLPT
jgi:pre-mRNA-splicing factor 38A